MPIKEVTTIAVPVIGTVAGPHRRWRTQLLNALTNRGLEAIHWLLIDPDGSVQVIRPNTT